MKLKKQYLAIALLQLFAASRAILIEENGKDLPSNSNFDLLARIKRPQTGGGGAGCNFNGIRKGKPRTDASGRTFFDLQFVNVGYNYNYDIHCGGGGAYPGGGGGNKPILGGGGSGEGINKPILHKPHHKPILGGHFQQGGQDGEHQGGNRPILSALFGNRPLQGIFSQTQTQTQTGIISDTITGLTSLLPKPQDIGQGLGEGISSFVSTLPQIGQSFQSLLPSFENFQFPSLPPFPSPMQGAQVPPTSAPGTGSVTPVGPDQVTDPDDTIYNDDIKPVHEDHDPVTDPHLTNKLPPGVYFNRNRDQIRYQEQKKYQSQKINSYANRNQYHYQQNKYPLGRDRDQYVESRGNERQYDGRSRYTNDERERGSGRSFRFPS